MIRNRGSSDSKGIGELWRMTTVNFFWYKAKLYSLHSLSPEGPGSDGASSAFPVAVTSIPEICFKINTTHNNESIL